MKNQRLAEALDDLIIKRRKVYRLTPQSESAYLAIQSVIRSAYWLAWSVESASWLAYHSVQLDKPKVLEIIKGKL